MACAFFHSVAETVIRYLLTVQIPMITTSGGGGRTVSGSKMVSSLSTSVLQDKSANAYCRVKVLRGMVSTFRIKLRRGSHFHLALTPSLLRKIYTNTSQS